MAELLNSPAEYEDRLEKMVGKMRGHGFIVQRPAIFQVFPEHRHWKEDDIEDGLLLPNLDLPDTDRVGVAQYDGARDRLEIYSPAFHPEEYQDKIDFSLDYLLAHELNHQEQLLQHESFPSEFQAKSLRVELNHAKNCQLSEQLGYDRQEELLYGTRTLDDERHSILHAVEPDAVEDIFYRLLTEQSEEAQRSLKHELEVLARKNTNEISEWREPIDVRQRHNIEIPNDPAKEAYSNVIGAALACELDENYPQRVAYKFEDAPDHSHRKQTYDKIVELTEEAIRKRQKGISERTVIEDLQTEQTDHFNDLP